MEVFMVKAGIIHNLEEIELDEEEIYPFLLKFIDTMTEEEKEVYHKFLGSCLLVDDTENTISFFVQVLGDTIISDQTVYFQEGNTTLDKIAYLKEGYHLEKLSKQVFENGRFKKYKDEVNQVIERIGFQPSISDENNLSFWYPKAKNLGFRTPDTIVIDLTDEEMRLVKRGLHRQLSQESIMNRVMQKRNELDLEGELFLRLNSFSNKFNFESCHLQNINELYPKLLIVFDESWSRFEWLKHISFVLREFIKAKNKRRTIYHGLPLNTEFRVFYDFDTHTVLGIYNYWDKEKSIENLKSDEDLSSYLEEVDTLEEEFSTLKPQLEKKVSQYLIDGDLKGKWSVDFLYDGEEFILIDMAHAECSYYYEKVLRQYPNLMK